MGICAIPVKCVADHDAPSVTLFYADSGEQVNPTHTFEVPTIAKTKNKGRDFLAPEMNGLVVGLEGQLQSEVDLPRRSGCARAGSGAGTQ